LGSFRQKFVPPKNRLPPASSLTQEGAMVAQEGVSPAAARRHSRRKNASVVHLLFDARAAPVARGRFSPPALPACQQTFEHSRK
jgi:hypothetical protein